MKLSLLTNKYFWYDLKYYISAFFNPRQKWLTKKIPKRWMDKPELIWLVLSEILVHYVEKEEGLYSPDRYKEDLEKGHITQEYFDGIVKRDKELRAAYDYIKSKPELEKQLQDAYPERGSFEDTFVKDGEHYRMRTCEELYGCSFAEAYKEVHKIEAKIQKEDQKALQTIIKYREYLWT